MKNLVLAALLTTMASTASAGIYSGIEYNSSVIELDVSDYSDLDTTEMTTSGFETYVGYDHKISNTLKFDVKAGYITGDIEVSSGGTSAIVNTTGYNITAGLKNKFDGFTMYGEYNYSVVSDSGIDVPSHGITTGIRFDF